METVTKKLKETLTTCPQFLLYRKCLANGEYKEALGFLLESAENGYKDAQFELAIHYRDGTLTLKEDGAKGVEWFKKAQENGSARAMAYVDRIKYEQQIMQSDDAYAKGLLFERKHIDNKRFDWYKKGAKEGDMFSQFEYAYCFDWGVGCHENIDKAHKWFLKSALQGYVFSQSKLGSIYKFWKKDIQSSISWFTKAALQGNTDAMYHLSTIYFDGVRVPRNLTTSWKWGKLANRLYNRFEHFDEYERIRNNILTLLCVKKYYKGNCVFPFDICVMIGKFMWASRPQEIKK